MKPKKIANPKVYVNSSGQINTKRDIRKHLHFIFNRTK